MTRLVRIPFAELCGFDLLRFDSEGTELAVDLRPDLLNSWGVAHGGLTMTLLDVTMAHAARSPAPGSTEPGPSVVTIEMKTSFMRPGVGRLVCTARPIHRTVSLAFCEGSVFDADGKLVSHATGTFKFVRGLPVGGKRIQRIDASE